MSGTVVAVVTAAALIAGAVVLVTARSRRNAVQVLLDLLTAAGLLRLATDRGWGDLAAVGVVIVLRQMLGHVLTSPASWSARQSPPPCGEDDHHLPLAVRREAGETGRVQ